MCRALLKMDLYCQRNIKSSTINGEKKNFVNAEKKRNRNWFIYTGLQCTRTNFVVVFDVTVHNGIATKIHIMCITITLLCRITYDNKMTVRKQSAREIAENLKKKMKKISKRKYWKIARSKLNVERVDVESKWKKKIWFVQNKMEWNEARQPCARQRIGWNDITTIRINKSKVILDKHIKTNIYRKIIGAQTNWLNRVKDDVAKPFCWAAKCLATNSKLHLSMTFSVEFDSPFPVMLSFAVCDCEWLPDSCCYRRATKWLAISFLFFAPFCHIESSFIVHLFVF